MNTNSMNSSVVEMLLAQFKFCKKIRNLHNLGHLRMSATGRSYTQNFSKVLHIIIQAILSRKSMKKIIVTDEKIFRVYKAFDCER